MLSIGTKIRLKSDNNPVGFGLIAQDAIKTRRIAVIVSYGLYDRYVVKWLDTGMEHIGQWKYDWCEKVNKLTIVIKK